MPEHIESMARQSPSKSIYQPQSQSESGGSECPPNNKGLAASDLLMLKRKSMFYLIPGAKVSQMLNHQLLPSWYSLSKLLPCPYGTTSRLVRIALSRPSLESVLLTFNSIYFHFQQTGSDLLIKSSFIMNQSEDDDPLFSVTDSLISVCRGSSLHGKRREETRVRPQRCGQNIYRVTFQTERKEMVLWTGKKTSSLVRSPTRL